MDVAGHTLQVEIADTQELRAAGLMNRRSLAENHGMLFVFESETRPSFWMKNTSIPLSLAFISSDGTIRQIEHLSPHSLMSVVSKRYVRYALEVNHGWFEKRAIIPGDRVIIPKDRDNS
ncbi:MAG: hypothetical protein B6D68_02525 [spirochete symbiont of Stewartia floridana]|nr:MAG: hypothetical protein B6D68_02525 [spirochete symbiont of Stewartia floridana]